MSDKKVAFLPAYKTDLGKSGPEDTGEDPPEEAGRLQELANNLVRGIRRGPVENLESD